MWEEWAGPGSGQDPGQGTWHNEAEAAFRFGGADVPQSLPSPCCQGHQGLTADLDPGNVPSGFWEVTAPVGVTWLHHDSSIDGDAGSLEQLDRGTILWLVGGGLAELEPAGWDWWEVPLGVPEYWRARFCFEVLNGEMAGRCVRLSTEAPFRRYGRLQLPANLQPLPAMAKATRNG